MEIIAINRSERPIEVTRVGFEVQGGSNRLVLIDEPPEGATLPGVIEPNRRGTTYMSRTALESHGFDLNAKPLTARAWLATRRTSYRSKPEIVYIP